MAKKDSFYFDNFVSAAESSCVAATYLKECLTNYDYGKIEQMLVKMHEYEHDGDNKKHEMTEALAKAFVTPMDREDMAEISHNIDEVTDCIEEVLQRLYVNRIETIMPEAVEFAERIIGCCELMRDMLVELSNFKKPQKLHGMIIDLSRKEEECDALWLKATLRVPEFTSDVLGVMFWREIFDHLESCADACEHVSDCVETIVMKNT